ncbi:hypothetical protein [Sporolactobacillus shoreicorticis]|uniref:Uncharacterized protein n=1 Tax=Sporolactobacillus shoreicorticis TaxID=1923877 RepID=A0ABW5RZQ8_9BACL|nr:hypothetical protein [Sporolactobacillus shoreicorticis]
MIQVNELGSFETPIVFTNTFSVGTAVKEKHVCKAINAAETGFTEGAVGAGTD